MARTHSQRGGQRKLRLSSLLEHKLLAYFQEEMELPGIVSITGIEAAPNMQSAMVWLSIYGADEEEVFKILRAHKKGLRKYLTKELVSKYIPEINFKVDYSQEHADKISRRLKNLE